MKHIEHNLIKQKELAYNIESSSIVLLASNLVYPTNADEVYPYVHNTCLYYLTGISQENTFFVQTKDSFSNVETFLFINRVDETRELWDGKMLTKKIAKEVSGISNIYYSDEFWKILNTLVPSFDNIYVSCNEHLRNNNWLETGNSRLIKKLQKTYPIHNYNRLEPLLHKMRSYKTGYEIDIIKKVCSITSNAFKNLLYKKKLIGLYEYELRAELLSYMLKKGVKKEAFSTIVASGKNSCVLHYITNNEKINNNDCILIDFGGQYKNYCADITRVIPASGRFTKRQKDIYNAVLRVHKKANNILKPGVMLYDYHKEVGMVMEKELIDLGLLSINDIKKQDPKNPAYKKYFMTGTSHFLGLDVHDFGLWNEPVDEGMVFTIEPGIYVPEESYGVRLENDYLIKTNTDNENLTYEAPIEPDYIEEIMNR